MDLLTQLQDKLDHLFLVFGTFIGVLQRDAPASSFENGLLLQDNETLSKWSTQTKEMALQVIETSKLIESIIDSLPGFNRNEEDQYNRLRALNDESIQLNQTIEQTKKDAGNVITSQRRYKTDIK
ncbi:hypothetical protein PPL_07065 [Heterostelium album PN500]|uniref:Mediator of RNA polymerase II transcription subunit 21 n=1 Tax=Heterostelium pallidum (strain ATCC 26659 / Pp 5 / PN500) TaxID=670386 RepID=D3BEA9_HETP5|nr:hypothetical protein PPL_07065 [Heterostelium album PN500]EFA80240.1 hypothetical protein PPL_07065 [Heterostelium album PN500]|eukprot:XP_020432360.1 hypothetical protein PPL_07065 [Heterostelium album PN500]